MAGTLPRAPRLCHPGVVPADRRRSAVAASVNRWISRPGLRGCHQRRPPSNHPAASPATAAATPADAVAAGAQTMHERNPMHAFWIIVSATTATVAAGGWLRWAIVPVVLAFRLGKAAARITSAR